MQSPGCRRTLGEDERISVDRLRDVRQGWRRRRRRRHGGRPGGPAVKLAVVGRNWPELGEIGMHPIDQSGGRVAVARMAPSKTTNTKGPEATARTIPATSVRPNPSPRGAVKLRPFGFICVHLRSFRQRTLERDRGRGGKCAHAVLHHAQRRSTPPSILDNTPECSPAI